MDLHVFSNKINYRKGDFMMTGKLFRMMILFLLTATLGLNAEDLTPDANNAEAGKLIEYRVKKENGLSWGCYFVHEQTDLFFRIEIDTEKFSKKELFITLRCEPLASYIQFTDFLKPNKIVIVQVAIPSQEVLKDWSLHIDELGSFSLGDDIEKKPKENEWRLDALFKEAKEKGKKTVDPFSDKNKAADGTSL